MLYPAGIHLFDVNNGHTTKMCEICSKLLDRSGIFVNFEQISHIVLVFPLFTSNKWMPARIKTSGRTSSNTLFEAYTYYS